MEEQGSFVTSQVQRVAGRQSIARLPPPCRAKVVLAQSGVTRRCATHAAAVHKEEQRFGVFVEVDKILIDAHNSVHRVAFNQAFQRLGHKSVSWPPEVFWQLLRSSAATPDSLVRTYYNTVGWPTNSSPDERQRLTESVQQKKDEILAEMVASANVPLRPGVQRFLEDAVDDGASVALISSTCSAPSERLVDAALSALGDDIAERMRVFQCPQGGPPLREVEATPSDDPLSLERSLQAATAHRRQQEAKAFLDTVNRSKLGADWQKDVSASDPGQLAQRNVGEGMVIDPSLLVATQRFAGLSPAWLAACVATLDLGLRRFALLGGTNQVMRAAQGAGIVTIAVPSSFSGRGTFSGADAVMDGFGAGGGVTWPGICRKITSGHSSKRRGRK